MGKKILKRFLVIIKWFLLSLLTIIVLVFLGLNIPATQRFFGRQLSVFLSHKTQKEIKIEQLGLNIWAEVTLQNVFIPDNTNDTLVSFDYLAINFHFWDAFHNKIHIEEIVFEEGQFNIQKSKNDSLFNFNYLIEAFASENPDTTTAPESEMSFELDKVQLINLKGLFVDHVSTMRFEGEIGSFSTLINILDLKNEQLEIEEIQLANTKWYFDQGNPLEENPTSSDPTNWLIKSGVFKIENTFGEYINKESGIHVSPEISFFQSTNIVADLSKMDIFIDVFEFNENSINYEYSSGKVIINKAENLGNEQDWHFKVNTISLNNNSLRYNDLDKIDSVTTPQIDFSSFGLNSLSLNITNLEASPQSILASINSFSLASEKLFEIESFRGDFYLDSKTFRLSKHQIKTAYSSLDYSLEINFPSLSTIFDHPNEAEIKLFSLNGNLHRKDISSFAAVDALPETIESTQFDVAIDGFFNNLNISKFQVQSENKFVLEIDGAVIGLPNLDSLKYDFKIDSFKTNLAEIRDLAQNELSTKVNLPHWIELSGEVKGTATSNETQLLMDTEMGSIRLLSEIDFTPKQEKYTLAFSTNQLAVGKLIGSSDLGDLTCSANLTGSFFDPNILLADLDLHIASIDLNNHVYTNGDIRANWQNKMVETDINIQDEYLILKINSKGQWLNDSLSTQNEITIDRINFKELNLSESNLNLQTTMSLETKGVGLEDLFVKLNIKKGIVQNDEDTYSFASSTLEADFKANSSFLKLSSPALLIDFESQFNIVELPTILEQHLSHYFDVSKNDVAQLQQDKVFKVSMKIVNEQLFEDILIPELYELDMNIIQADYNSVNQQLNIDLDVPHIKYKDLVIDSIQFNCNSSANELLGEILVSKISTNGLMFFYPSFKFLMANNRLDLEIALCDEQRKQKFGVKGDLQKISDNYVWHTAEEEGVVFYYEPWTIAKDNKIIIDQKKDLQFVNFSLLHQNQSISAVNTVGKGLKLGFNNFTIENITSILYPENESIKGIVNGAVVFDFNHDAVEFNTDIQISDFTYVQDTIGNVDLKVQHLNQDNYHAQLNISGANRLEGKVNYSSRTDRINGQLNLTKFDLSRLSKHTHTILKDLSGIAKGHVAFDGTISNPNFTGKLSVNEAVFHVVATNTSYEMKRFDMFFDNNKVVIEDVWLEDRKGNKAVANGYMTLDKFFPEKLFFDLKMDKFPLLNTAKAKDEMVYGNLSVSSILKVRGTFQLPEIEAKLKLTPGSELTFVVPESEVSTEDYSDVVEFVDFSKPTVKDTIQITEAKNVVRDIQINAFLEVTPDVKLTVIVDPVAGDYMEIKGNANLNFKLSPDGQMKLIGIYAVKEGHYQMTYHNVIKRKFDINDGSTVSWSGDIYDPLVNITAIYTTKASLLPLVQAQVSNSDLSSLKQSVPVNVLLNISDHMLTPKLNFDIQLPNSNKGTSSLATSKLNNMRNSESEMNKQAFSLLVLNRFIPENISQNSGSSSLKSSARGSVSQIISDQFNSLAGNYIKSVNVNFNLDSYTDYSSGEAKDRTDLEIELSKTLFNDKIVVTVGSDFNVEGNTNNDDLNNIVGNVKAVYSIDEDGNYLIKVYRKNEYAGVIDGNITKTGLSFVFSKEFKTLVDKQKEIVEDTLDTKPMEGK